MREVRGDQMMRLLGDQIAAYRGRIRGASAPLAAEAATNVWLRTPRAVEESTNLPSFGLDDPAIEHSVATLSVAAFTQTGVGTGRFGTSCSIATAKPLPSDSRLSDCRVPQSPWPSGNMALRAEPFRMGQVGKVYL
jgi:hypothetical protein